MNVQKAERVTLKWNKPWNSKSKCVYFQELYKTYKILIAYSKQIEAMRKHVKATVYVENTQILIFGNNKKNLNH